MRSELSFAKCDGGRPTKRVSFENVTEFVGYAEKNPYRCGPASWAVTERAATIYGALNGDEKFVPGATALLDEVDLAIPPTHAYHTIRGTYGTRANMGDWLAGSPTPMRRRGRQVIDRGPVKILVSFVASASLSDDVMLPRGNAIMALVMKIQQTRPVKLVLFDETRVKDAGGIPMYIEIGIDCQPLSLAHVGFAVSSVGFFRHLGLGAEYEVGAEADKWPVDYHSGSDDYEVKRFDRMGLEPCDVVLSAATDWNPLVKQPVEWIKAELARIGIE